MFGDRGWWIGPQCNGRRNDVAQTCSCCLEIGQIVSVVKKDMLHILEKLTEVGAGFRSLTENADSTVRAGKMLLSMLGDFSEFERSMVRKIGADQLGEKFRRLPGG
jgi:Resolvase, N terminal domain